MNKFVIVDIETTGHSPKKGDRMIQFAGVVLEDRKITETFTTFLNPGIPISPFITELTGIDNEMVANAPSFTEVAGEILQLMEEACFVAHNAHFDLTFLQDELELGGFPKLTSPVIDTVEMTRIFMPTLESYKLSDIANFAGFDHDRPHQADSDAIVTAEWFLAMLNKLDHLPDQTIFALRNLAKYVKSDLFHLLDQWYLERVSHPRKLAVDLELFRGIVLKKEKVDQNLSTGHHKAVLEKVNLQDEWAEESPASFIHASLDRGDLALIETGAETNHKFSYLLAAAVFSMQKNKPVLVATATVHDQQVILQEIIPQVRSCLAQPISVQLLKGRNRYLNLWKFERILHEHSEHYDEVITKMQILVWLTETETGDCDELNLSTGGWQFLRRISGIQIDKEGSNPWFDRDFYRKAVTKASAAQIVVTNHHYLLTNVEEENNIFSDFEYVIIDEAHLFENNALSVFGMKLTYRRMKFLLNQLGPIEQMKVSGKIDAILTKYNLPVTYNAEKVQLIIHDFLERLDEFFQTCVVVYKQNNKNIYNGKIVIENTPIFSDILYSWERVYDAFTVFFSCLEERLNQLFRYYHFLSEQEKMTVEDFSLLLTDLTILKQMNMEFQDLQNNKLIWLDMDERNPLTSIVIHSQPLYVEDDLAKTLYLRKKAIIFISNALTVEDSFQYMIKKLGLNDFPVVTKQFYSTESFYKQIRLYSLNDLPNISEVKEEEYIEKISNSIIAIATTLERKLLILFSSNEMLKKTYHLIKDSGALDEYLLMAQGVSSGSLHRLSKQFSRFDKVILFISNSNLEQFSFDQSLQTAIMVRLPFLSPNEPVHYHRAKALKNKGINSFQTLSLPEAVIRFKQGFVKLMNPGTKIREWIIFDKRIYSTSYGRTFLHSIPPVPLEKVDLTLLCKKLDNDS
ncbi:ATP-dependent DNA helicase DinG [Caldifermentibacillus hisashii]|uniref:ATP-dependent DNA helicase DinG n=1 Tax=Caldifermentibacillus hisashii TaxID=996558 RepID=UPI001F2198CD|nr:ATP-dependent DNA helicase DinG [Caldifermentibacillus hisashii]MEC5271066.1 ATP-dependent DNA helicase DinG [Caldifermentibacillus hisashii]MED4853562.1 ATP-dependent DNA helicase DinG [Caldifermentibacillus hisashii]